MEDKCSDAVVRDGEVADAASTLTVGEFVLDTGRRTLTLGAVSISFTCKETGILQKLMLHPDTTVSKDMLLSHLYGGLDEPEFKIIDVFVCRIRKKIETIFKRHPIETVWGRGYKFLLREPGT